LSWTSSSPSMVRQKGRHWFLPQRLYTGYRPLVPFSLMFSCFRPTPPMTVHRWAMVNRRAGPGPPQNQDPFFSK
jgi:hypothetical protein